jgi:hypothetical protein
MTPFLGGLDTDNAYLPNGDWKPFYTKFARRWNAESHARRICESFGLEFIDFDGPYSEIPWRLGFRRPKWTGPPPGIPADKWAKRLKSTDELAIYKAGIEAGRSSISEKHRRHK